MKPVGQVMALVPHGSVLEKQAPWAQLRTPLDLARWWGGVCEGQQPAGDLGEQTESAQGPQSEAHSSGTRTSQSGPGSWRCPTETKDTCPHSLGRGAVKGAQSRGSPPCMLLHADQHGCLREAQGGGRDAPNPQNRAGARALGHMATRGARTRLPAEAWQNPYAGKSWCLQRDRGPKMVPFSRLI